MFVALFQSLPVLPLLLGTGTQPEATYQPLGFSYESSEEERHYSRRSVVRLETFLQNIDLGDMSYDHSSEFGSDRPDIKDVPRERLGFRASFGRPSVRGYVQFFGEKWEKGFVTSNSYDLLGFGGGVTGEPVVGSYSEDNVRLVIPYRAGLNMAIGSNEESLVKETSLYVELEAEVGFGAYLWGFRPMAGFYTSNLEGVVETEVGPDSDFSFSGTNIGAFLELRYKHDNFPVFASIRGQSGDVEGLVLTLGASF
ncbi:MAG: hypothetical protein ACI8X5_003214 [Planctomycetota bacterium]|jgi:hypothetical protein